LNGQLTRAATNLFIPSTLHGQNKDPSTGQVNDELLRANMETAKQVYIDRVNNTSYNGSTIKLYPSSCDQQARQLQERRDHLLTYIRASVRHRQRLRENANAHELVTLDYYDEVLLVMHNHCLESTVKYVLGLICCFRDDCPHPQCRR
jgi:hypothetical protein